MLNEAQVGLIDDCDWILIEDIFIVNRAGKLNGILLISNYTISNFDMCLY